MSTLVLMRLLESAPHRYDAGMRWLSLGAVPRAQRRVAELAVGEPGMRILEIGCGTGAVTERLLAAGAVVDAFDHCPPMLDRARARLRGVEPGRLTVREASAAEMDALPSASVAAVVASLVLSEMSADERAWALREARRILVPGGRLVIAAEVRPRRRWQRAVHACVRLPLALVAWVVVGAATQALADLATDLARAGFAVVHEERSRMGTLAVVVAAPTEAASS